MLDIKKEKIAERMRSVLGKGAEVDAWAAKTGDSRASLYNYREGKLPKAVRTLLRISQDTGKSLDWLLTGKEEGENGDGRVTEEQDTYSPRGAHALREALEVSMAMHKVLERLVKEEAGKLEMLDLVLRSLSPELPPRGDWTQHIDALLESTKKAVYAAARAMGTPQKLAIHAKKEGKLTHKVGQVSEKVVR